MARAIVNNRALVRMGASMRYAVCRVLNRTAF
jgi:hypothetical protein